MAEPSQRSVAHGLRDRLSEDVPLVAVSFRDRDLPHQALDAAGAGLDVAELRIDLFDRQEPEHVAEQAGLLSALPTIATVRVRSDGGAWTAGDAERRTLFEAVLPHVDALDLELSSPLLADLAPVARAAGKLVIASAHDFDGTPPAAALDGLARDARDAGADLVKIATAVTSAGDLRRLARFTLDHAEQGVIVIGMGARGMCSRVFFPALGSRITYTFVGEPFAPGQLNLEATCRELRLFYPQLSA